MNGVGARNAYDYDAGRRPPPRGRPPPDAYGQDVMPSFGREKRLYNTSASSQPPNRQVGNRSLTREPVQIDSNRPPQNSTPVDLKDPIQVHLLTETALSDSKEYEILSQEDVDDLKKQIQSLVQRVEQTRSNLAIQSKYRDAAVSMAKLYSSPSGGAKRRSLLGDRGRSEDEAREAELERRASERRCDELTAELSSLEGRLTDSRTRLLQHTAGILQLTHRASSKKSNQPSNGQPLLNGIPGSPESLYTSNGRDSLDAAGDDMYFEGRSLYLPLDEADGQPSRPRKNVIEIPMKSPVREQQNQLREETDRLRDENVRLNTEAESLRREGAERTEFIADTERKLEGLTGKLRDMVLRVNPARNDGSLEPPARYANGSGSDQEPGGMLGSQIDYLERGLAVALEEQGLKLSESREEAERAAAAAAESLAQTESRVEAVNRQVYDVLQNMEPDYPSPPGPSGQGLLGQLDYLQDSFRTVQTQLSRAAELSSSTAAEKQKNDQFDAVLMGLWDIIQTGYTEIRQQEADRRRARAEKGLEDDDTELSSDESLMSTDEPYSLQTFSAKVQWLYAQATSLREQKIVLKRQIKQQRELNNKSSSDKDTELAQRTDELRKTQDLLNTTEMQARDIQDKLSQALNNLDTLQRTSAANEAAAAQAAEDQLKERNAKISTLESDSKDLQGKLSEAEASIADTKAQLAQVGEAKTAAEAEAFRLQQEVKGKDDELERMNMLVVELKTEATIAKAELDGAYGSRAERAAEAAALNKESEESVLATEVGKLKSELAGILRELEDMTKETIAAEKEKLELEGKLDDVLTAKTSLEAEVNTLRDKLDNDVSRLQEQLDAERLKVPSGSNGQASQPKAGASMLSEQFRATMKEERRKFQEEIRVCSPPPSPLPTPFNSCF